MHFTIYQEIYYKVIQVRVRFIEYGRYKEAYDLYKNNILDFKKSMLDYWKYKKYYVNS